MPGESGWNGLWCFWIWFFFDHTDFDIYCGHNWHFMLSAKPLLYRHRLFPASASNSVVYPNVKHLQCSKRKENAAKNHAQRPDNTSRLCKRILIPQPISKTPISPTGCPCLLSGRLGSSPRSRSRICSARGRKSRLYKLRCFLIPT
jgi:hypothetical protein